MTETERILQQYDRALYGGAWHGKAVWEILATVAPEIAFAKPDGAAHSIWQLVRHMTYWESEVFRRIARLPARPEGELNFPAMPEAIPRNWESALEELRCSNSQFRAVLCKLEDNDLDLPLSGPAYTHYVEIHGVIQHHLYHAGQIAFLQRNLTSKYGGQSFVIPKAGC